MESYTFLGYSPILLTRCVAVAKELQGMSDSQEINNGKYGCVNQSILSSFCQGKKKKKQQACKPASYSLWY